MNFGEHFASQVDREKFKETLMGMLDMQMQRIYKACSKSCLKSFEDYKLSFEERKCLTQCFQTRNETQQIYLQALSEKIIEDSKAVENEN